MCPHLLAAKSALHRQCRIRTTEVRSLRSTPDRRPLSFSVPSSRTADRSPEKFQGMKPSLPPRSFSRYDLGPSSKTLGPATSHSADRKSVSVDEHRVRHQVSSFSCGISLPRLVRRSVSIVFVYALTSAKAISATRPTELTISTMTGPWGHLCRIGADSVAFQQIFQRLKFIPSQDQIGIEFLAFDHQNVNLLLDCF